MSSGLQDLRYGLRLLRRAPAFTAVAVLSLAMGIGASAAIFGAINGLLLKPVAAAAPERLVAIFTSDFSGPAYGSSSYADAIDFARGAPALKGLATASMSPLTLTAGPEPERVFGELVSPNYFDVLGLQAVAGRLPAGSLAVGPPATEIVITRRFWQRRFDADPGVIGRGVRLGRDTATIVGVAPDGYTGLTRGLDLDLFVVQPITAERRSERGSRGLVLIGRLADDATLAQAQAQLDGVARGLHDAHGRVWTDVRGTPRRVTVAPEQALRIPPDAATPLTAFLLMLALTVGLVLLVACANVAGLLIARAADRRQEIAVRLSLGAGRGRLIRQLLIEAGLLASLAGIAGLAIAQWMLVALEQIRPPLPLPVRLDFDVDGTVLGATTALATLTAIAFGLVPALQATRGLAHAASLRGGLVDRARRLPLRGVLVTAQIALSIVLLVFAGLFVRSLQASIRSDVGFDDRRVLVATIDPAMLGYSRERGAQLYADLVARLRTLPGVEAAGTALVVPLALDPEAGRRFMRPSGYEPRPGEDMEVHYNAVSPGYLATLGIRLLRGRDFADTDRMGGEPVIIVNEAFAARYWPGRDPLAQHVQSGRGGDAPRMRVIGVAANTRHASRGEAPRPMLVLPFAQHYRSGAKLHVRTTGDPAAMAPAVRAAIRAVEPGLPVLALNTLAERTSTSLLPQQIAGGLIGAFGAVALLLSLLGVYGMLARSVAQRSREIGVRLALGAAPGSIVRLVLAQGWRFTAAGLVAGLLLAAAGARLLRGFLPGIGPLDAAAYAGAALLLGTAATIAMWLPVRRALAVDPAGTLRSE